jgi:superoxide dismutase, Fe-Mn family
MHRKDFIHQGIILCSLPLVPGNSAFVSTLLDNQIDKLVDKEGNFIQPPLPFAQNALEPYMDEETLNLHYTFHHGGAVKGANKDLSMIKEAVEKNDLAYADYWTKKSAHHFSSHVLHSIFWTNLSPKESQPKGELLKRIEKNFGSYEKLKALLTDISKTVLGNGWGILAYQPYSDNLVVLQCENHEKLTQWGAIPLLVIDVWEHAYYLKYKNKRDDFVENIFRLVNWDNVGERLAAAIKLR